MADRVQSLPLGAALERFRRTGGDAAEFAMLLDQALGPEDRDRFPCLLARYGLHEFVSRRGEARLPGGVAFDPAFLQLGGFPFGFITHNAVSVQLPSATSKRPEAQDQIAVLSAGTALGLFELLDTPMSRHRIPVQPWTIQAGSENVFSLAKVQTAPHFRMLASAFGPAGDIAQYQRASTFWRALDPFQEWHEAVADWRVEIVFLPPALFESLDAGKPLAALDPPKLRLWSFLYRAATLRLTAAQNYFDGLLHVFCPTGDSMTAENRKRKARAYQVWKHVLSTALRARPLYKLTTNDERLFPVSRIARFFEEAHRSAAQTKRLNDGVALDDFPVLVADPDYSDEPGFLLLDEVVETTKSDDVLNAFFDIRMVYQDSPENPAILEVPLAAFFEAIAWRSVGEHRTTINHQRFDPNGGGSPLVPVAPERFFCYDLGPSNFFDDMGGPANANSVDGAAARVQAWTKDKPLNAMLRVNVQRLRRELVADLLTVPEQFGETEMGDGEHRRDAPSTGPAGPGSE